MASSIRGNTTKREGSARIRSNKGTPVYECSYSYIVECTTKSEDYLNVLNTAGLPVVGITVEPTGFAVCTAKNGTRREDNPMIWDVTCEFSSEIDDKSGSGSDPSGGSNDPTTWVPLYETKMWQYEEPSFKDVNGVTIANSAGQPFPTYTIITRFLPMWEFFQIESASVTDSVILDRCNVINSAAFKGLAAETLLCTVVSSVIGRYYGALRRLTQYQLRYQPAKWTLKKADIGTSYLSSAPVELVDYRNDSDTIINGPLDGSGGKANDGQGPPAVLEIDIYSAVSFSFLRI